MLKFPRIKWNNKKVSELFLLGGLLLVALMLVIKFLPESIQEITFYVDICLIWVCLFFHHKRDKKSWEDFRQGRDCNGFLDR